MALLLAGAKRTKQQYSIIGKAHHQQSYKALKDSLKRTIWKESKNNWC